MTMNKITDWTQLPEFADERSEAAFWAIHQLDVRLMNITASALFVVFAVLALAHLCRAPQHRRLLVLSLPFAAAPALLSASLASTLAASLARTSANHSSRL